MIPWAKQCYYTKNFGTWIYEGKKNKTQKMTKN